MQLRDVGNAIIDYADPPVWLVTARAGEQRGGLIATFVHNCSIVPEIPRVLVGISREHHTWRLIEQSRAFALHLFGEERIGWVARFGLRSGRDLDKFTDLSVGYSASGSPVLDEALLWLDCRVEASMDIGDRTMYLGEVTSLHKGLGDSPLRQKRMLALLANEQRQSLADDLTRDRHIDAANITKWRQRTTASS